MRQLLAEEFDWSGQVAAITAPTLVVVGDADTLPVAHAVELFTLLGGETAAAAMGTLSKAQLAVLPATTHFGIVQHAELPALVSRFLDGAERTVRPRGEASPRRISIRRAVGGSAFLASNRPLR